MKNAKSCFKNSKYLTNWSAFFLSSRKQYEEGKNRQKMFQLKSVGQTVPFEFPRETVKAREKPGPASTEGKQSQ